MVGFVGGAGTGKTELGNLLETAKVNLANENPEYFQFTFEFYDLDKIPYLRPLLYGGQHGGDSPAVKDLTLNRSPIVLLPPRLQAEVVRLATANFRKVTRAHNIEMDPLPFLHPSGKTQAVVDAIVRHYLQVEGRSDKQELVTDRDYMRWVGQHVRIVRRTYDEAQPPAIIRYVGKHPDMSTLLFSEDLMLSSHYGPGNPLSYKYGMIPQNDGKGIFIDELFRQDSDVRDTFLDLAQNGVAQNGGAPPEFLNTTIYFASNDDSIVEAQENGGAKAHLDRTNRLPMRNAIEPWFAVKIALMDIGPKRFSMRKIDRLPDSMSGEKPKPLDDVGLESLEAYEQQTVLPDAIDGNLVGPDGRYALYYHSDPATNKTVLIAPRSLWMLGLIAAGTRIVTSPAAITKANQNGEFSTFAKFSQYFIDPKERLHVLNGSKGVPQTVLGELEKARDLLREGINGIGARNVENWLSHALLRAVDRNVALSPTLIAETFSKLLDEGSIPATLVERTQWIQLVNIIKKEFILPALTEDVINIVQGRGRSERIYEDIRQELLALSADTEAEYIEGQGNDRMPIDKQRLNEIYAYFQEMTGNQFEPGQLKDFHLQAHTGANIKHYPPLMAAIRRYLAKREMDKTSMSELVQFFDGKPVADQTREKGRRTEHELERYGYDRTSFHQALRFVRDYSFELEKQRKTPSR